MAQRKTLLGSKTWNVGLLASIFTIFASFLSGRGFLFFVSVLLILVTTPLFFASSKQKQPLKESHKSEKGHFLTNQEKNLNSSAEYPQEEIVGSEMDSGHNKEVEKNGRQDLLYSESESTDQNSSSSSEDHSSDIEYWPHQRMDSWDDSISDEESLIEIDIPNGQFVYPDKKHPKNLMNLNCCKLPSDFLTDGNIHEINEEDNLIEIDIYMGSIKGSSFEI